jgi:hypothetical protein
MQDGLQGPPLFLVGEDHLPHCLAVERTVCGDDARAEGLANLTQGRLARRHDFARHDVGVDYGDPEFGKEVSDGGLAAGDAAGQTDDKLA